MKSKKRRCEYNLSEESGSVFAVMNKFGGVAMALGSRLERREMK